MKDRKTMVLTLIAIVTLSLLVIGATFAYFGANNSASGSTTVTTQNETIGSVIVTNPTENLYMKLSSYDMQESYKGTSYYATEDSTVSHSKGKENNVIAKYSITGGEQSTVYNCSFNMSINKPSEIQKGDMTLKFTGIGAKVNGLSSVSVDLANADSTYQVTFSRVGNGIGNLVVGDITFNNTETEQNYLESKTLNTSVTLSGMECSIETTEEPDLFEGTLTPVVYDGDNWKIVSADDKKWYDYENQEWANAVILKSDSDKGVGDTVSVEGGNPDVLAMYVWIPRYEYRIEGKYGLGGTSKESPGEIEVNFISKDTIVPSEGYIVHPAFTLGGEELPGIWVGKFEISHTTLSSSKKDNSLECSNELCSSANGLRILPNVESLRYNNVSNFFYGIKSMEQDENVFGINSDITDSHMIKNSEWGAVSYLTQSAYGKYGNNDYSGTEKEILINDSVFLTGMGVLGSNGGIYTYDGYLLDGNTKTNEKNIKKIASTTGNVTGIYDMSGSAWEYVMGILTNDEGTLWSGGTSTANSGFIGNVGANDTYDEGILWPNIKYYDTYKYKNLDTTTTADIYNNRYTACNNAPCIGDTTIETIGWYNDQDVMITVDSPWIIHGGDYNSNNSAGIFAISRATGKRFSYVSTRSILTSKSTLSKEYKLYENGEVVYFDVETGLKCTNYNIENSKTGYNGIDNRTGNQNSCLKFYAFDDNGGNKLNLLLDHNTTATSLWNINGDNSTEPINAITNLKNDTKDWKGTIEPSNYTTGVEGRRYTINYEGLNARLITANEISKISGLLSFDENKSLENGTFHFDSREYSKYIKCTEGNLTDCRYGWLYDRTSIDCETEGCLNNSEVETSGYWSISASVKVDTHEECGGYPIYGVSHHGRLGKACPDNGEHYGIRPVIEINKSDIGGAVINVCTIADDSTVAAGEYGAKYNCKVDPNKDAYTFYLIKNNTDGTSNLIMNANINSMGEAVIPGVTEDNGDIEWYAANGGYEMDYSATYGPITAMKYLHNATKSWTNVEPLNYIYYDNVYKKLLSTNGMATITASDGTKNIIGSKSEPLRARMPEMSEIISKYDFFVENLDSSEKYQPTAYWTINSGDSTTYFAYFFGYYDLSHYKEMIQNHAYSRIAGVRPVITVKL